MSLAQATATAAVRQVASEAAEVAWREGCVYLGRQAAPWQAWEVWIAPGVHEAPWRTSCQHVWRLQTTVERDPLHQTLRERLCAAVGETFQAYERCGKGCGMVALRTTGGRYGLAWQERVNPGSPCRRMLYWVVELEPQR